MVDLVVCLFKKTGFDYMYTSINILFSLLSLCVCLSINLEPDSCVSHCVLLFFLFFVFVKKPPETFKLLVKKRPNYQLLLVFTRCIYRRIKKGNCPSEILYLQMFDDINLVHLLSTSKPLDLVRNLNDQQIRSILPSLIWIGLQQCPKNHRLIISAEILQIVSHFHEMDSIIELFQIDFHSLNLEIKRLQRIKQKVLGGGQQNSNVLINQEIIAFEQAIARDRCRIVAQILFDDYEKDLQLITSKEMNEREIDRYPFILLDLLDEPNHVRIVGDVLCVLVLHLSHSFKFDILISNLLHSKYAYEYLIRLILNIPTLKLTLAELIIRCSQNDDIRYQFLRTFIKLYPIHKLRLLRLCYQRNTLLLLILDLLDHSTINLLLLILSNSKQRLWFKKYQTQELVHNLLRKLFQLYEQKQCSIHFIFKITVILHIHCNVK